MTKHICDRCNKYFKAKANLDYHLTHNVCQKTKLCCQVCNKIYTNSKSLDNHVSNSSCKTRKIPIKVVKKKQLIYFEQIPIEDLEQIVYELADEEEVDSDKLIPQFVSKIMKVDKWRTLYLSNPSQTYIKIVSDDGIDQKPKRKIIGELFNWCLATLTKIVNNTDLTEIKIRLGAIQRKLEQSDAYKREQFQEISCVIANL